MMWPQRGDWPQGFIEVDCPFAHVDRLIYGPALAAHEDMAAFIAKIQFVSTLLGGQTLHLFDYWLDKARTAGGVPAYTRHTLLDLVAIAPWLTVRGRRPGSIVQRFRYYGEALADRTAEMTGRTISEQTGRSDAEEWANARHVYEDGRFGLIVMDLSYSLKKFAHHSVCTVPFADPETGDVLYALSAHRPVEG